MHSRKRSLGFFLISSHALWGQKDRRLHFGNWQLARQVAYFYCDVKACKYLLWTETAIDAWNRNKLVNGHLVTWRHLTLAAHLHHLMLGSWPPLLFMLQCKRCCSAMSLGNIQPFLTARSEQHRTAVLRLPLTNLPLVCFTQLLTPTVP